MTTGTASPGGPCSALLDGTLPNCPPMSAFGQNQPVKLPAGRFVSFDDFVVV